MNCRQCHAQLAPGAQACPFCGTPSASHAPGGAPGLRSGASALWHTPAPAHAGIDEGWRVWLSTLLFGTYAPAAGLFLLQREEWTLGLRQDPLPPSAPSQRGLYVVGLLFLLPMLASLCVPYLLQVLRVGLHEVTPQWRPMVLQGLQWMAMLNLLVAAVPLAVMVWGRWLQRRAEALLVEVTHGDPVALMRFGHGTWVRVIVGSLTAMPLVFLLLPGLHLPVRSAWESWVLFTGLGYALSLPLSAWAASWFCLHPVLHLRRVLQQRP
jgi:hypothetical protein